MDYFFLDKDIDVEVLIEGKNSRKIKAYNDDMMMVEVYMENGAIGSVHKHPHTQTTFCLEGAFEFYVGDETQIVNAGDSIYMPPDIMHGCKLLSEKGRLLDVFTPTRKDFLEEKYGKK